MAYFSITNIKETTVYVNVSGLDNTFSPDKYIYIGVTDYEFPESDKSIPPDYTLGEVYPEDGSTDKYTGFQVRGLDEGETYTFYCFAQATNGNYYPIYNSSSGTGTGITFTTAGGSNEPVFTVELYGNTVRGKLTGYPSDAIYFHFYYQEVGSSTWERDGYIEATSSYYYYQNLSQGKSYKFRVFYNAEESDSEYIYCDDVIDIPIALEKWSWTSSNGSATTSQTKKAYTAITSQGKLTDFSYLVWNDMVDKAVEILDASGKTWLTKNDNTGATYATATNTRMTSSDREMTALRFNSLKFQIGNKIGTGTTDYPNGIQDVERGDKILGEYFVIFGSKLNDWIDKVL